MAFWFIRGLRRGVVTTGYPKTPPGPWTVALPTPPVFRARALTAARVDKLVARCPTGALRRDDGTLVFDVGACTACGRCLMAGVAEPSGQWELAATSRADLVKRIPIAGGDPPRGDPS
jgi:ferredoxin